MKKLPSVSFQNEYIRFVGGLDVETPPVLIKPGFLSASQNFEQSVSGGYETVQGYERYSGQTSPSTASYAVLSVTGIVPLVAVVGATLTGVSSGRTSTIIAVTATTIAITKASGVYTVEDVNVGASYAGSVTGYSTTVTVAQGAIYKALASDVYRALIAVVPGSGAIRGVWYYGGKTYAFRDNAGGTAVDMYESSSSGWLKVVFGKELSFDTGSAVIAEGSVVTGAVSSAHATVSRVVTESGAWTGTAKGRLILTGQVGNFQVENLTVSGVVAHALGDSTQIAFAIPGGRFNFCNANFGSGVTTNRMYGCDGKNRGFEFDGTTMVPISTGMTVDAPEQVCFHKWHLFFSFFGSLQHSSLGMPYQWTPITGAAEIGIGDTITNLISLPGSETAGALLVLSRNERAILYGTTTSDWNMVSFKKGAGGLKNTAQEIGGVTMLDDRGLTSLVSSANYGNFADATISTLVKSWITSRISSAKDSCIVREKNQYRIFFSDGYALYVTYDNGSVVGMLPIKILHPIECMCSLEDAAGREVIFFGSTNGMVYQMDVGTSFDGAVIEAFLETAYYHFKTPNTIKRFRKMVVEATGDGYAELYSGYKFDYGEVGKVANAETLNIFGLNGWFLDSGIALDSGLFLDGASIIPISTQVYNSGKNLAFTFRSSSAGFQPIKISGVQVPHTSSRIER